MRNRFGTNSAVYDLSRIMALSTGVPSDNELNAPIILDNPVIASGIALFSHTPQPFTVAVTAASELTLIDLNFANTGAAGTQFYGIKIETDTDVVDTGAGIALFNVGRSDAIYIDVAGKPANPVGNAPTGIGIDINKETTSTSEQSSANSSQQGIQIFDWSTTDQGVGGPRGILYQKQANLNTDHLGMTLRGNRNLAQFVIVSAEGGFDSTKPVIRFDDETTGDSVWVIRASGEQIFNNANNPAGDVGIQWLTGGGDTAYILASTKDLKLKSGGTGIRFVNEADTQTIVMMQDDLSVDIPNNEVRFKALKIVEDRLENYITNALASVSINYNGYNGGTTQFRDTKIFDGKQNVIAIFTGTYKNVLIGTATDKATTQPHVFLNDGVTMMQQGSGSTGYSMLMWNLWSDNGTFKRRIATNPTTALYVGPAFGAGAVDIYFNTDAGNTVDSTASLSRVWSFGATTLATFGSGGATKATVSGYNDNPALASLLTGLTSYGLITDSSTVGSRAHGSCYGNEIGWTQAAAVQNTWYIISDADMADGHGGLNLVAHDGSGRLTVTNAGVYDVSAVASIECSLVNKHVQIAIAVNGTPVDVTPHYDVVSPGAQLELAAIAEVTLAASGYVEVAIRTTDTGTPDLSVDHLAIKIQRLT